VVVRNLRKNKTIKKKEREGEKETLRVIDEEKTKE
jgi:hypothetical protein